MIDPARVSVVGDPPVARSSEEVATPTSITPPLAVSAYAVAANVESATTVTSSPAVSVPATVAETDGVPLNIAFGNGKVATAPLPPVAIAFEVPSPAGGAMVDSGWPDGASSRPQFAAQAVLRSTTKACWSGTAGAIRSTSFRPMR